MMYQVSALNALLLGYTRKVVTVETLLRHGDTGLGTFVDAGGEMIVMDGRCFRASDDGSVDVVSPQEGVPFASVAFLNGDDVRSFDMNGIHNVESLKNWLDLKIEEDFGLNSMHVVRIDGTFEKVSARSESAFHGEHVDLKDILKVTQKSFEFNKVSGSLICLYYPDYMQGMNAAGWHFHFLSSDCKLGGHVFDIDISNAKCRMKKLTEIQIELPKSPAFDTYSLTQVGTGDVKSVEQGKS